MRLDALRRSRCAGRPAVHVPSRHRDLRRWEGRGARGRRPTSDTRGRRRSEVTHVAIADSPRFRTILARPRRRRHPIVRWYRRNERVVLSLAGVVAFFALWQIGADRGVVDQFFFSAPTDIAAAAWEEVQNPRFW